MSHNSNPHEAIEVSVFDNDEHYVIPGTDQIISGRHANERLVAQILISLNGQLEETSRWSVATPEQIADYQRNVVSQVVKMYEAFKVDLAYLTGCSVDVDVNIHTNPSWIYPLFFVAGEFPDSVFSEGTNAVWVDLAKSNSGRVTFFGPKSPDGAK